jgi:hypothetical protein
VYLLRGSGDAVHEVFASLVAAREYYASLPPSPIADVEDITPDEFRQQYGDRFELLECLMNRDIDDQTVWILADRPQSGDRLTDSPFQYVIGVYGSIRAAVDAADEL